MPNDVRPEVTRSVKNVLNIIGATSSTVPNETGPVGESDGTLRVQLVGWDGGVERVAVTTGGVLKTLSHGEVSGTVTAVELEAAGGLQSLMQGKDSGGNLDPLRTNANQQLQVEIVDGTGSVTRKTLGQNGDVSTEAAVYTVPSATETTVDLIVCANREASANTVTIGISVGGGALAAADYLYFAVDIPANDTLRIDGPFYMTATDELRFTAEDANVTVSAFGREYA